MKRSQPNRSLAGWMAVVVAASLLLSDSPVQAEHHESTVAAEIRAVIMDGNRYVRENLMDPPALNSKDGSIEFWSSGGLMQSVTADSPRTEYDSFSLTAKHIEVIELPGGESAVAMYYSEGSMHPKGGVPVSHYMTRVTQVFVKEDGSWKARAGHWSPIRSGAGTSLTAVEE